MEVDTPSEHKHGASTHAMTTPSGNIAPTPGGGSVVHRSGGGGPASAKVCVCVYVCMCVLSKHVWVLVW